MECSMGAGEARFAELIWSGEPISSTELAKLSEEILGWKKSTSYTVLKRLCQKGIFQNQAGIVTACVSKADFFGAQSEKFVEDTFDGSLPAFLTAFGRRKKLSDSEVEELKRLIDGMRG